MKHPVATTLLAAAIGLGTLGGFVASFGADQGRARAYLSHPPMRPLPTASRRPMFDKFRRPAAGSVAIESYSINNTVPEALHVGTGELK